ncbi:MAG: hypothetical protein ABI037_00310 [Gemmatimonadales bacterium]
MTSRTIRRAPHGDCSPLLVNAIRSATGVSAESVGWMRTSEGLSGGPIHPVEHVRCTALHYTPSKFFAILRSTPPMSRDQVRERLAAA